MFAFAKQIRRWSTARCGIKMFFAAKRNRQCKRDPYWSHGVFFKVEKRDCLHLTAVGCRDS